MQCQDCPHRNIEKQVSKAQKALNGQIPSMKMKFLSMTAKSRQLNLKLIDKARALAGIKGYVTNLDISDKKVIAYYHQLFQIEASFRMAKPDLRARPIYHQNRDAIDTHLTIVFAALAISRNIEYQTGIEVSSKFLNCCVPYDRGLLYWMELRFLRM